MAEDSTTTALELPKPQRYLTPEEAVQFLGLRSKASLNYLHRGPDGPPYIALTKRTRSYCLADLLAWSQARKTTKK
jgi:hypothetical protein